MKIFVKVKTRAKRKAVEKIDAANFIVSVIAVPEKGKANPELREKATSKTFDNKCRVV